MNQKLIVGISGASGVIYGIRMLEVLKELEGIESHLILSKSAEKTIQIETDYSVENVIDLADQVYQAQNMAAAVSSGSFLTLGMVILPCSIKTLSGVAHSFNDNLLVRAADVCLKERRKLVLVPRETPLHKGHLELMIKVADHGGVILPPAPSFYHDPKTILDIVDQTIGKVLDQFQIPHQLFKRWQGK